MTVLIICGGVVAGLVVYVLLAGYKHVHDTDGWAEETDDKD